MSKKTISKSVLALLLTATWIVPALSLAHSFPELFALALTYAVVYFIMIVIEKHPVVQLGIGGIITAAVAGTFYYLSPETSIWMYLAIASAAASVSELIVEFICNWLGTTQFVVTQNEDGEESVTINSLREMDFVQISQFIATVNPGYMPELGRRMDIRVRKELHKAGVEVDLIPDDADTKPTLVAVVPTNTAKTPAAATPKATPAVAKVDPTKATPVAKTPATATAAPATQPEEGENTLLTVMGKLLTVEGVNQPLIRWMMYNLFIALRSGAVVNHNKLWKLFVSEATQYATEKKIKPYDSVLRNAVMAQLLSKELTVAEFDKELILWLVQNMEVILLDNTILQDFFDFLVAAGEYFETAIVPQNPSIKAPFAEEAAKPAA